MPEMELQWANESYSSQLIKRKHTGKMPTHLRQEKICYILKECSLQTRKICIDRLQNEINTMIMTELCFHSTSSYKYTLKENPINWLVRTYLRCRGHGCVVVLFFFWKRVVLSFVLPKKMLFLTISNERFFFLFLRNQGTKLSLE